MEKHWTWCLEDVLERIPESVPNREEVAKRVFAGLHFEYEQLYEIMHQQIDDLIYCERSKQCDTNTK